jgi:hypothetical protein
VEFGWTDALNGLVLLGDGKGGFEVLKNSGFHVPGNAKNIRPIKVNNRSFYVISQNHDKVKLFEYLDKGIL